MKEVICTKRKRGIFKDTVELTAVEDCNVCYDSFMGERMFYMKKDSVKTVKISKKCLAEVGDCRSFSYWLGFCNPFDFAWDWS